MSIADEIRRATARNELHELVRTNAASPRGLCNAHKQTTRGEILYCTQDYGHEGAHANGLEFWETPSPPSPPSPKSFQEWAAQLPYGAKHLFLGELEAVFAVCKHPWTDAEADWCNVCGATRLGDKWLVPHWRDLLHRFFFPQTKELEPEAPPDDEL